MTDHNKNEKIETPERKLFIESNDSNILRSERRIQPMNVGGFMRSLDENIRNANKRFTSPVKKHEPTKSSPSKTEQNISARKPPVPKISKSKKVKKAQAPMMQHPRKPSLPEFLVKTIIKPISTENDSKHKHKRPANGNTELVRAFMKKQKRLRKIARSKQLAEEEERRERRQKNLLALDEKARVARQSPVKSQKKSPIKSTSSRRSPGSLQKLQFQKSIDFDNNSDESDYDRHDESMHTASLDFSTDSDSESDSVTNDSDSYSSDQPGDEDFQDSVQKVATDFIGMFASTFNSEMEALKRRYMDDLAAMHSDKMTSAATQFGNNDLSHMTNYDGTFLQQTQLEDPEEINARKNVIKPNRKANEDFLAEASRLSSRHLLDTLATDSLRNYREAKDSDDTARQLMLPPSDRWSVIDRFLDQKKTKRLAQLKKEQMIREQEEKRMEFEAKLNMLQPHDDGTVLPNEPEELSEDLNKNKTPEQDTITQAPKTPPKTESPKSPHLDDELLRVSVDDSRPVLERSPFRHETPRSTTPVITVSQNQKRMLSPEALRQKLLANVGLLETLEQTYQNLVAMEHEHSIAMLEHEKLALRKQWAEEKRAAQEIAHVAAMEEANREYLNMKTREMEEQMLLLASEQITLAQIESAKMSELYEKSKLRESETQTTADQATEVGEDSLNVGDHTLQQQSASEEESDSGDEYDDDYESENFTGTSQTNSLKSPLSVASSASPPPVRDNSDSDVYSEDDSIESSNSATRTIQSEVVHSEEAESVSGSIRSYASSAKSPVSSYAIRSKTSASSYSSQGSRSRTPESSNSPQRQSDSIEDDVSDHAPTNSPHASIASSISRASDVESVRSKSATEDVASYSSYANDASEQYGNESFDAPTTPSTHASQMDIINPESFHVMPFVDVSMREVFNGHHEVFKMEKSLLLKRAEVLERSTREKLKALIHQKSLLKQPLKKNANDELAFQSNEEIDHESSRIRTAYAMHHAHIQRELAALDERFCRKQLEFDQYYKDGLIVELDLKSTHINKLNDDLLAAYSQSGDVLSPIGQLQDMRSPTVRSIASFVSSRSSIKSSEPPEDIESEDREYSDSFEASLVVDEAASESERETVGTSGESEDVETDTSILSRSAASEVRSESSHSVPKAIDIKSIVSVSSAEGTPYTMDGFLDDSLGSLQIDSPAKTSPRISDMEELDLVHFQRSTELRKENIGELRTLLAKKQKKLEMMKMASQIKSSYENEKRLESQLLADIKIVDMEIEYLKEQLAIGNRASGDPVVSDMSQSSEEPPAKPVPVPVPTKLNDAIPVPQDWYETLDDDPFDDESLRLSEKSFRRIVEVQDDLAEHSFASSEEASSFDGSKTPTEEALLEGARDLESDSFASGESDPVEHSGEIDSDVSASGRPESDASVESMDYDFDDTDTFDWRSYTISYVGKIFEKVAARDGIHEIERWKKDLVRIENYHTDVLRTSSYYEELEQNADNPEYLKNINRSILFAVNMALREIVSGIPAKMYKLHQAGAPESYRMKMRAKLPLPSLKQLEKAVIERVLQWDNLEGVGPDIHDAFESTPVQELALWSIDSETRFSKIVEKEMKDLESDWVSSLKAEECNVMAEVADMILDELIDETAIYMKRLFSSSINK